MVGSGVARSKIKQDLTDSSIIERRRKEEPGDYMDLFCPLASDNIPLSCKPSTLFFLQILGQPAFENLVA